MKKKYTSEILEVIHQDAQGLYDIGAIDATRMREFDEMCLAPALKPALKGSTLPEKPLTRPVNA
jgi:putative transcriptional regulator